MPLVRQPLGGIRSRAKRSSTRTSRPDVESVRQWWSALDIEQQLSILHFEDRTLIERLHAIQQMLRYSELMCFVCGIGSRPGASDASTKPFAASVGLDSFEFECRGVEGSALGLVAFKATRKFLESEDLIAHLDRHLDGFLADSRPILTLADWEHLFDATPNSWSEFLCQVLRLVESSLLRAYQDSLASSPQLQPLQAALEDITTEVVELETERPSPTKSSRRKAKKKRSRTDTQTRSSEILSEPMKRTDSWVECDDQAEVPSETPVESGTEGARRKAAKRRSRANVRALVPSTFSVLADSSTEMEESEDEDEDQEEVEQAESDGEATTAPSKEDSDWQLSSPSVSPQYRLGGSSEETPGKEKEDCSTAAATPSMQSIGSEASSDTEGPSIDDSVRNARASRKHSSLRTSWMLPPASSCGPLVSKRMMPDHLRTMAETSGSMLRPSHVLAQAPEGCSPCGWSTWIHNEQLGNAAEWQFTFFQPLRRDGTDACPTGADAEQFQAVVTQFSAKVKHTFLDVPGTETRERILPRAHSVDPNRLQRQ